MRKNKRILAIIVTFIFFFLLSVAVHFVFTFLLFVMPAQYVWSAVILTVLLSVLFSFLAYKSSEALSHSQGERYYATMGLISLIQLVGVYIRSYQAIAGLNYLQAIERGYEPREAIEKLRIKEFANSAAWQMVGITAIFWCIAFVAILILSTKNNKKVERIQAEENKREKKVYIYRYYDENQNISDKETPFKSLICTLEPPLKEIVMHTFSPETGVSAETVEQTEKNAPLIGKWFDVETKALYCILRTENGKQVKHLVSKARFEQEKTQQGAN